MSIYTVNWKKILSILATCALDATQKRREERKIERKKVMAFVKRKPCVERIGAIFQWGLF
jgi:hypothetical protein